MVIDERYLVVLSGPSGSGKDTISKAIRARRGDIAVSISCTTRRPRGTEKHGEDYYFISKEDFLDRVARGRMLEYTEYAGNYYGTPMDELEKKLDGKTTVLLVIEVNGARKVKEVYPNSLLVFIVPPSLEELEKRLKLRNTETDMERSKRMEIAKKELKHLADYDFVIENDIVDHCAERLSDIIDEWQS